MVGALVTMWLELGYCGYSVVSVVAVWLECGCSVVGASCGYSAVTD